VADAATVTVYDPTNDAGVPADFDALYLLSDETVSLEMTCNEGDANEALFVVELTADLPFVLFSDASTYGATPDLSGTADVIDKLRVKNSSGSTATIRLFLGT